MTSGLSANRGTRRASHTSKMSVPRIVCAQNDTSRSLRKSACRRSERPGGSCRHTPARDPCPGWRDPEALAVAPARRRGHSAQHGFDRTLDPAGSGVMASGWSRGPRNYRGSMPAQRPGPVQTECDVEALRAHLEANNGIKGLEVLDPSDIDRAVRIFQRDGFVVVRDALDDDQLAYLRAGVAEAVEAILALDGDRRGNRGTGRYSFGGSSLTRSMLHRPEWQMLVDLPTVTPIVTAIFQSSDHMLRAASGLLPARCHAVPVVAFRHARLRRPGNLAVQLVPRSARPPLDARPSVPVRVRELPDRGLGSAERSDPPDPGFSAGAGTDPDAGRRARVDAAQHGVPRSCGCRPDSGCAAPGMAAHRTFPIRCGPSPTSSCTRRGSVSRVGDPGISAADHRRLSPHAQRMTRFVVADSGDELVTGATLTPPR